MVQIAVKPLTRIRLNNSVLKCVKVCRHNKFADSLLGIVESSICEGPIYFNCFLDFSVLPSDLNVQKTLTVNIKTQGLDMNRGSTLKKLSKNMLRF